MMVYLNNISSISNNIKHPFVQGTSLRLEKAISCTRTVSSKTKFHDCFILKMF